MVAAYSRDGVSTGPPTAVVLRFPAHAVTVTPRAVTCSFGACRLACACFCGECGRALCAGHGVAVLGGVYCSGCREQRANRRLMQTWLDEEAVLAHSQWATAGTAAELAALWLALASAAHSVSWSVALLLPVLAAMVAWRRMFGSCRSGEPEAVRRRMMRWATAAPGLLLCSLVLGGLLSGLRDRGCRRGGLDELQWLVAARACAQQGVRLGGLALALWRREMETGSRSDEGCPESVS